MSLMLQSDEIGGARVRRRFTLNGEDLMAGRDLTAEQVKLIPVNNRDALVRGRFIHLFPKAPEKAADATGDVMIVSAGSGRYDVVIGKKMNEKSMSKEEATAYADSLKAKSN